MTSPYHSRASGLLLAFLTVTFIKGQSFLFFCCCYFYSKAISSLKTIFPFIRRTILLLLMFSVLLEAKMPLLVQIKVYHRIYTACQAVVIEDLKVRCQPYAL